MARLFALVPVFLLAIVVGRIRTSEDALKKMTNMFLKALDDCKHELNLSDNIIADLYHYWKDDHELLHRDTGCAIACMSRKLDMLDAEGKLHHENAHDFAKTHGADIEVATKLIDIIRQCEKESESIEDECLRILDEAKCFRANVRKLEWAPKMEVIVTELLSEI